MEDDPDTNTNTKTKKTKSHLRDEWNMFWDGLVGGLTSPVELDDPFVTGKLKSLTLDQIKAMTKALSVDRRQLNQQIEALHKEIESTSRTLENLKLVGGESEETIHRINELTDLGQSLTNQLGKLNQRLQWARQREDELKRSPSVD